MKRLVALLLTLLPLVISGQIVYPVTQDPVRDLAYTPTDGPYGGAGVVQAYCDTCATKLEDPLSLWQ